jgi:EAL domain-containing protein (putative c-di-GMP-specific phosphodiesterase class I)
MDRVLGSVRSYLGMDVAFISEFTGPDRVFRNVDSIRPDAPLKVGGVIPMAEGYCQKVVDGVLPELIPNTGNLAAARAIPETHNIPIGAHLSVPIRLKAGRVFGTFCCFSYLPNPALDKRDLELMHTFAKLVAKQIDFEIEREAERNAKIERIRAAVANGDPKMVYQPICRLSDGAVTGVEALSRFATEPSRSPEKWFLEAAEVGMGEGLELLAIRKAVIEGAGIPAPLTLGINISPDTATGGRLAEVVTGFDLSRLVIEVTEHTPIDDYEPLVAALAPFRAAGAKIAIDDAGAGYASLRHVLTLKPDIIKLDLSITRGVDTDSMRSAMAAALAEFARLTGTEIVAEGIESEAEVQALRKLGVAKGQGYYFARPGSLEGVAELRAAANQP